MILKGIWMLIMKTSVSSIRMNSIYCNTMIMMGKKCLILRNKKWGPWFRIHKEVKCKIRIIWGMKMAIDLLTLRIWVIYSK
jgi:hypothetical protein